MDSGALGQELKRKLKKANSTGSVLKSTDTPPLTPTRTPKLSSPALPSPALPTAAAAAASTSTSSTPPTPSAANTPPPVVLKPLVPKLYLEEAASTPQPRRREEEDEEDVASPSLSGKKPSPLRGKLTSMNDDEDDDGWEEDKSSSPHNLPLLDLKTIEPFVCMVRQLRGFFPLLPNRLGLDAELSSGIALCRKIAGLYPAPHNETILGEIVEDYSPALAVVSEWKNLRLFVRYLFQKFPRLSIEFPIGEEHIVGDLLNQSNLPRFFALLLGFAKESGYAPQPQPQEQQQHALSQADVEMLQRQSLPLLEVALKQFQASTLDESRLRHPIYQFLKTLGLEQHFVEVVDLGFDTLDRLCLMGKEDCVQVLGSGKPGHVKQLLQAAKQLSATAMQSPAERWFEFHHSNPLSDDFWLREERAKLQQLRAVKVHANNSTFPAFRDAMECAEYLLSLTSVPSVSTTAVLDFTTPQLLLFGFAGAASPVGQLELVGNRTRFDTIEHGVTQALQRMGKGKIKQLLLVGVALNAAVLDFALKTCPSVFLCGPKSTSALGLRVFGLVDGVCVDFDSTSNVARAFAIRHAQVIPQATAVATVEQGEDLSNVVEACLLESLAKPGARVKGGLVLMDGGGGGGGGHRKGVSKAVQERFSCGVFPLNFAATRWACAAQIAVHPNFQHRWITAKSAEAHGLDDALFPLVSFEHRKSLVSKSMCALHVLHRMVLEEEDRLSVSSPTSRGVPASPLSKVAAAVALVEARKSSPVAPPPPPTSALKRYPSATAQDKFEKTAQLFKKLEGLLPRAAFLDAKAFILQDMSTSSQPSQSLLNLTLSGVIQRLPPHIKSKLSPDVMIMEEDEDGL